MLRPTLLKQPTGSLQLRPRAMRVASPWSLGLLDLDTFELRRQLARLPSNMFHLVCEVLRMDRISEVAPVQEICRTL